MTNTVTLLPNGRQQFINVDGQPLSGGTVSTYIPGGLTPKTTWQDSDGTTANSNPLTLDILGSAAIWGSGLYRQILKDSNGNVIWDVNTLSPQLGGDTTGGLFFASIAAATVATIADGTSSFILLGYYTPGDGGGAQYIPTSGPSGPGKLQSADGQWWVISNSSITFEMFGAKGDFNGSSGTDDTSAIQNALTFGKNINVLPKNYLCTSVLTGNAISCTITGCGDLSTLTTNSSTLDLLEITDGSYSISNIKLTSSVTKSSGYLLNLGSSANFILINNVTFSNWWGGLTTQSNIVRVTNCNFIEGISAANAGVEVTGSANTILQNIYIQSSSSTSQSNIGIVIKNCNSIVLDNVLTFLVASGIVINPDMGQTVQSVLCTNSVFSSGTSTGISIIGAGTVNSVKFSGCSSEHNTNNGLNLQTSGNIDQVNFINCIFLLNTTKGAVIDNSLVINTTFINCVFSLNGSDGLYINSNIVGFKIIGCSLGTYGDFGGNGGYGLVLNGNNDSFIISDNTFVGNTSGSINIVSSPAGTLGITNRISGNIGFNTYNNGSTTLSSGATATIVSHGLDYTPSTTNGGSIVPVLSTGLGTAAYIYIDTITSSQFTINTNTPPGAGIVVDWSARTLGT